MKNVNYTNICAVIRFEGNYNYVILPIGLTAGDLSSIVGNNYKVFGAVCKDTKMIMTPEKLLSNHNIHEFTLLS